MSGSFLFFASGSRCFFCRSGFCICSQTVQRIHDSGGRDGGAGNGIDIRDGDGQCLANELLGKLGFFSLLAETVGFVRSLNAQTLDGIAVENGLDNHVTGESVCGGRLCSIVISNRNLCLRRSRGFCGEDAADQLTVFKSESTVQCAGISVLCRNDSLSITEPADRAFVNGSQNFHGKCIAGFDRKCLVNGIDYCSTGDGGTRNRFDVLDAYTQGLADELVGEGCLGCALAQTFGFIRRIYGEGRNVQCIVNSQVHGDCSGKSLRTAFQSCAGQDFCGFRCCGIHRVYHGRCGDCSTGNGIDIRNINRKRFSGKLISELGFHGTFTETICFGSGIDSQILNGQLVVK